MATTLYVIKAYKKLIFHNYCSRLAICHEAGWKM